VRDDAGRPRGGDIATAAAPAESRQEQGDREQTKQSGRHRFGVEGHEGKSGIEGSANSLKARYQARGRGSSRVCATSQTHVSLAVIGSTIAVLAPRNGLRRTRAARRGRHSSTSGRRTVSHPTG